MRTHDMLRAVRDAIGGRRVVWFGIRGEDGEALLQLPELEACFAVTASMRSARLASSSNVTLEELSGERPDLDRHDIDLDPSEAAAEFRRRLLAEVSSRCVVITYRPAAFISSLAFSMTETMTLAGLFKDRQLAFEHKPWVETSLAKRGVPVPEWHYVADEHHSRAKRLLAGGPLVLRASRSSGGVGMTYVETEGDIDRLWPRQSESFVAVAPYFENALPLNLTGCVFSDGTIRLHPASVQLIGIASFTERPFGYCGNDFGAVSNIEPRVLDRLDALARSVGAWLHEERYIGVFGVDAMSIEEDVFFTEVNARFQGSSAQSAEIAAGLDQPDIFLDHLAASLGVLPSDAGLSVAEWAAAQPALSHVVVHNTAGRPLRRDVESPLPPMSPGTRIAQLLPGAVEALPGATLFRVVIPRSVTRTGFEVDDAAASLVSSLLSRFHADVSAVPEAANVAR